MGNKNKIMNYPKQLLNNILWNFDNEKFSSQQDFEKAVIAYNEKVTGEKFAILLSENILNVPYADLVARVFNEADDLR